MEEFKPITPLDALCLAYTHKLWEPAVESIKHESVSMVFNHGIVVEIHEADALPPNSSLEVGKFKVPVLFERPSKVRPTTSPHETNLYLPPSSSPPPSSPRMQPPAFHVCLQKHKLKKLNPIDVFGLHWEFVADIQPRVVVPMWCSSTEPPETTYTRMKRVYAELERDRIGDTPRPMYSETDIELVMTNSPADRYMAMYALQKTRGDILKAIDAISRDEAKMKRELDLMSVSSAL